MPSLLRRAEGVTGEGFRDSSLLSHSWSAKVGRSRGRGKKESGVVERPDGFGCEAARSCGPQEQRGGSTDAADTRDVGELRHDRDC